MTPNTAAALQRDDLHAHHDLVYFPLGAAAFGGAERSILELAAAQQARGKRVLVCYERALDSTAFIGYAQSLGVPLRRVGWAPEDRLWTIAWHAVQTFRSLRGDVLHFNVSWRAGMWIVPLLARLATASRLLGSVRAMPDRVPIMRSPTGRRRRLLPRLSRWALRERIVDRWFGYAWGRALHHTVSVNAMDYPPRLVREFGFPPQHLSTIYNGIHMPDDVPTGEERRRLKQALGYHADDLLVGFVGRVSREKGIQIAIEALQHCDAAIRLVVAGDGPEMAALQQLAAGFGVLDKVRFIGYVDRSFDVFRAVDAAVVPSLWNEAFGRVVAEAMACGAVVVATRVGGMQELFTHGLDGLFVPAGDAVALAAALNRLAQEPLLRQALGAAGRALAQDRYSTVRVAAEYAALYAELIQH